MKKRLLLTIGFIALVGLTALVAFLWWTQPTAGICRYTANIIRPGMTEEEVTTIIGKSPDSFRVMPEFGSPAARGLRWSVVENSDASASITVWFDNEGLVWHRHYRPASSSWEAKLRRWLHFD